MEQNGTDFLSNSPTILLHLHFVLNIFNHVIQNYDYKNNSHSLNVSQQHHNMLGAI